MTEEAERYRRRVQRSRCPRSSRWRAGTKHTARTSRASDCLTQIRHTLKGGAVLWQPDGPGIPLYPRDNSAGVSIYDGGTNRYVPPGPRAAASREYKLAQRTKRGQ